MLDKRLDYLFILSVENAATKLFSDEEAAKKCRKQYSRGKHRMSTSSFPVTHQGLKIQKGIK